jgi:hypothetical protein
MSPAVEEARQRRQETPGPERFGKFLRLFSPDPPKSADSGAPLSVVIYSVEDMQTTQPRATSVADATDDLSAREVLDLARTQQRAEDAAAARKLEAAARWADLHPPESRHGAASYTLAGIEHEEAIAGPGCPSVAEFCIAELGTVLGISTTSAKRLIGHSSCGTGSRGCGRPSTPAGSPPGEPGWSPRPPSTPPRP